MMFESKMLFKTLLFLSLTLIMGACSDTSGDVHQAQAQERAGELVDQQNDLVFEINSAGLPRASWSESKITDYEKKLDELEYVEKQLDLINGGNGVTITGGKNTSFIESRRDHIRRIKAQKNIDPSSNSRREGEEDRARDQKIKQLIDVARENGKVISENDFISTGLSEDELLERAQFLKNQEELLIQIKGLNDRRIREQKGKVMLTYGAYRSLEEAKLQLYQLNEVIRALEYIALGLSYKLLEEELIRRQAIKDTPVETSSTRFGPQ